MSDTRYWVFAWWSGLVLLLAAPAFAIDGRARATLERESPTWVGQQIVLNVELLSNGTQFSSQRIRLPEVPGAVVLEDAVTTVRLNEQVDGETWQVLRYRYPLFAQRPGELAIDPIQVRFEASVGYGNEPQAFAVVTEALSFEVVSPPGFDLAAGLVTTTDLTLRVRVTPSLTDLMVGDAVTRTITRSARDVSAMVFAPLPSQSVPGLAAYSDAPEITDQRNRGEMTGTRIDSITYVLQRPGPVTLTALEFPWWDPVSETMNTERVPALTLNVAANPALAAGSASVVSTVDFVLQRPWTVASVLAALSLAIWAGIRWLPVGLAALAAQRARRGDNERARFTQVLRACSRHDAVAVYNAFLRWQTLNAAAASVAMADQRFVDAWQDLQSTLVGRESLWLGRALIVPLREARRQARRRQRKRETGALPALNP